MEINQDLLEETLRIKLNLLRTITNKRLKSIMVTSANHGEGTSILVANLAFAFALDGKTRVLLVDANIRRPNLHTLFGLECKKGFLDFIGGNTGLAETIRETAFPNIHLMTAGQPRQNDALIILAAISKDAKNSIETGFDLVLYDTAPVNSYPDTLMTTTLADGIILVILAEKTRHEAVSKAKKSLEAIEAHILGGVLNERK
ncbi:MAG: CpsD/CapB family tyrosine-protein kinase [Proteobacteria bacterium]|nr:CpsD/CapB family tyrosine-protein kinase [Pseudomonadota bacterium]